MTTIRNSMRHTRRAWWLCSSLACIAVLVGCATPQQNAPAASPAGGTAEQAQPATNARPAKEAPTAEQTPTRQPTVAEEPAGKLAAEPPPAEHSSAAAQPTTETATANPILRPETGVKKRVSSLPPDKMPIRELLEAHNPEVKDMDAQELAEYIRKLAEQRAQRTSVGRNAPQSEAGAAPAAEGTQQTDGYEDRITSPGEPIRMKEAREASAEPRAASLKPATPVSAGARKPSAQKEEPKTDEANKKDREGGCSKGGGKGELTPPPPNQPQPKYACKQNQIVRDDVWKGQRPEFVFTIANEGEAPLQVNLRGG